MKPHILSQGEQIPQTFLWLSVNSSLGYEEKEEDKQRGVSPPSRKAGDRLGEERQLWRCYRGGGGVGRLQVSSTTSHCPQGRRHPPAPTETSLAHSPIFTDLQHSIKQCPGGNCSHGERQGVDSTIFPSLASQPERYRHLMVQSSSPWTFWHHRPEDNFSMDQRVAGG